MGQDLWRLTSWRNHEVGGLGIAGCSSIPRLPVRVWDDVGVREASTKCMHQYPVDAPTRFPVRASVRGQKTRPCVYRDRLLPQALSSRRCTSCQNKGASA
eukprot:4013097-Pyramimonas_sp.AAC.1